MIEEGLTVRAVEDLVRQGGSELRVVPDQPDTPAEPPAPKSVTSGTTEPGGRRASVRKLPSPACSSSRTSCPPI